jgi:Flp pilus assembly protein TadD
LSGYVVCPACGTRIKAGREHCLKCFEPLPPPDEPVRVPLSVSLGLSKQSQIILGAVAVATVGGLLFVILTTASPATTDDAASAPVPSSASGRSAVMRAASEDPGAPPMPAVPPAVTRDGDTPADADLARKRDESLAAIERLPNDATMRNQLGLVLAKMGENDEALKQFDRAVALGSRTPEFRVNFGNLLGALGQWGRAVDQFREAILLAPRDYVVEYGLAVALQRKGDHDLAIPEFEKARRLKPDQPAVTLGLAASLERAGRREDAVREYRKFLGMQPNSADAARVGGHLAKLSANRP